MLATSSITCATYSHITHTMKLSASLWRSGWKGHCSLHTQQLDPKLLAVYRKADAVHFLAHNQGCQWHACNLDLLHLTGARTGWQATARARTQVRQLLYEDSKESAAECMWLVHGA